MHVSEVFAQHLPPDWANFRLIVWGYQVVLPQEPVPATPLAWNVADAHCLLLSGTYTYYRSGKIRYGRAPDGAGDHSLGVESTPDGLWLLMGAPENTAGDVLRAATAMLVVWLGRNAVYEKYFEFQMDASVRQIGVHTLAMLNPMCFGSPDFTRLSQVEEASRHLAGLPVAERSRLLLSLRWYSDALSVSGTDEFLRVWIAFEVLAMNTTSVKSASDLLAAAYGIAKRDCVRQLRVGRLQDLRSAIVHKGTATPPKRIVINFLEALYTDCVSFRLSGKSDRTAMLLLDARSGELDRAIAESKSAQ
jgi:hypothetical protein